MRNRFITINHDCGPETLDLYGKLALWMGIACPMHRITSSRTWGECGSDKLQHRCSVRISWENVDIGQPTYFFPGSQNSGLAQSFRQISVYPRFTLSPSHLKFSEGCRQTWPVLQVISLQNAVPVLCQI